MTTNAKQVSLPQSAGQNAPPQQPVIPPPPPPVTPQDELNIASRWMENARYLGALPQAALMYKREDHVDLSDSSDVSYEVQLGSLTGVTSGLLIGGIFHLLFKRYYKKINSDNPLYRNFKTLASFGGSVGMSVGKILPLPAPGQNFVGAIIADLASIVFGLFAIPYWFVRAKILKIPQKTDEERKRIREQRNDIIGTEGWSKYGKTFLVYGASLGQVIGYAYSQIARRNLLASMALIGGITSIVSFIAGLALVPLINKFCNKVLRCSKETFRNNYVRSGMTFGMAVGSTIGFILGTLIFPGVGSSIGMAVGAAIGGVVGGTALGVFGKNISAKVTKKWNISDNTDNSWDYATRSTSYLFAFLGAVVGFFVPVPGGVLAGAAIGSAIGGVAGWFVGFGVIAQARKVSPIEKRARTLPWTQRVGSGSGIGSIIGGGIGFLCGLFGGPAGAVAGALLGGAIGGFLGGILGAFYDRHARHLFQKLLFKNPKIKQDERELDDVETELDSRPLLAPKLQPSQTSILEDESHQAGPVRSETTTSVTLQLNSLLSPNDSVLEKPAAVPHVSTPVLAPQSAPNLSSDLVLNSGPGPTDTQIESKKVTEGDLMIDVTQEKETQVNPSYGLFNREKRLSPIAVNQSPPERRRSLSLFPSKPGPITSFANEHNLEGNARSFAWVE